MLWRANSTWPLAFSRHCFPGTILPILGGKFATPTPRLVFSAAITAISSNPTPVCFFFCGCLREGCGRFDAEESPSRDISQPCRFRSSIGHHGGGRESHLLPDHVSRPICNARCGPCRTKRRRRLGKRGTPAGAAPSQTRRASRIPHGDSPRSL